MPNESHLIATAYRLAVLATVFLTTTLCSHFSPQNQICTDNYKKTGETWHKSIELLLRLLGTDLKSCTTLKQKQENLVTYGCNLKERKLPLKNQNTKGGGPSFYARK